ncbi:cadherin-like beta sandwich domain-containing protein [Pelagicoccus sp. SDUM812005]|uniref:cadherin-like beta sandwich domain-containing protein n=1 Tax=Pelagicoccus sp. SDUM812005 TaxID=3041257 RepID=UPI00280D0184|nr:cadherin-like beta sandwich domain-containing protein [Pelagicoccus sp. SDUM812005]MDQ8181181.1 cadherin-like beta sandwich domain-containing protein [Pelagicoccus sp. SDUM812005]
MTPTTRPAALLLATATLAFLSVADLRAEDNPRQDLEPDEHGARTFNLYLKNDTHETLNFLISEADCTDSPLDTDKYGSVAPGGQVTVWIARVQGNGCDGENGSFRLRPSLFAYKDSVVFMFSNDGGLWLATTPNLYQDTLTKDARGHYTYTIHADDKKPRLATAIDERLTQPRNRIAYDSGEWGRLDAGITAKVDLLRFDEDRTKFFPAWFESCVGEALYHPQHVKRLPNKDGKAYFMIAQSRAHNGYITLVETYPNALDETTDRVFAPDSDPRVAVPVGEVIWQDVFTGKENGNFNRIGNWNHPAKMAVMGGVLVVVAQNWSEGIGLDGIGCSNDTSNPYQRGESEDALLFYDIRDPAKPAYWGMMSASDLELPSIEYFNGTDGSGRGGHAKQISVVSLAYIHETGKWRINAGGRFNEANYYTTWETNSDSFSPKIEDWEKIASPPSTAFYTSGEHGDDFESYQLADGRARSGTLRNMSFVTADNGPGASEVEGFTFASAFDGSIPYNMGPLEQAKDWVAESVYVTERGETLAYTVQNSNPPDGGTLPLHATNPPLFGHERRIGYHLFQVHDTRNTPPKSKPFFNEVFQVVENTNDSGPGSLRAAIARGGRITFLPAVNGKTLTLTSGPLVVYLEDTEIAGYSPLLPNGQPGPKLTEGFTIVGDTSSDDQQGIFLIEGGRSLTVDNLNLEMRTAIPSNAGKLNAAVYVRPNTNFTLRNSTIITNPSVHAVLNLGGTVLAENSTITMARFFHTTEERPIVFNTGTMTLRSCTVAPQKEDIWKNSAIYSLNATRLELENTIVATYGYNNVALFGDYHATGANLITSHYRDRLSGPAAITADPQLSPLANNGGTTKTFALQYGSPAIASASASPLTTDQRGKDAEGNPILRIANVDSVNDLGAFESMGPAQLIAPRSTSFSISGDTFSWSNVNEATYKKVFLTSADGTPSDEGETSEQSWELNKTLEKSTEYFWRIDTIINGNTYKGPIQSVTTRGDLIVTTLLDENDPLIGQGAGDSLRETIAEAVPGETIRFASNLAGKSITLDQANGQILLGSDLILDASNLNTPVTIIAAENARIFEIAEGATVTLKGLKLTSGRSDLGGAIYNNESNLTLEACTLRENEASQSGGAIYNDGGTVTLLHSRLTKNKATQNGGGIYNANDGSLIIKDSKLLDNQAVQHGGALYNSGASFELDRVGAIGNGAERGGAIANAGTGVGLIENSTLQGNGASSSFGGGAYNDSTASLTLRHVTTTGNVGGGIYNANTATLTLENSIVASNVDTSNSPIDYQGNLTAVGANIVETHDGSILSGPTPISADPHLERVNLDIQRAPKPGSPALDAAIVSEDTPSLDQNGDARTFGGAPDLGAIEAQLQADASLLWVTTSAGPIYPGFRSSTYEYKTSLPDGKTSLAVRAGSPINSNQNIEIKFNDGDFSQLNSKAASADFVINSETSTIELKVTAQNLVTVQSYLINVLPEAVPVRDGGLASLASSLDTIAPIFNANDLSYAAYAPNEVDTVAITAMPADESSKLEIRKNLGAFTSLASGVASNAFSLDAGKNLFDVRVISDGNLTTATYELAVTRAPPALANANLSALATGLGKLSPAFSPGETFYKLVFENSTESISITPTLAEASASAEIRLNEGNFSPLTSGQASNAIALNPGFNLIEVRATAANGTTTRTYKITVSRTVDGLERVSEGSNDRSFNPSISADCRYIAFSSRATNLVDNDTNNKEDVFVYDRANDTTKRVSISQSGVQGNFESSNPSISSNGRFVAFESEATNLVPNDENGNPDRSAGQDIFVYDLELDTIERVSLRSNGSESNQASQEATLSGDGRYVAFASGANNLVPDFNFGEVNVYLVDREEDTIIGIPVPFEDILSNQASLNPVISSDGKFVAFEFHVSRNIDQNNESYSYRDIYLFNRETKAVERVTGTISGVPADAADSSNPSISGDGRYIAFDSELDELVFADTKGEPHVYVYDRETGVTQRVSKSINNIDDPFRNATHPSISQDGRYIAFQSNSSTLVENDTNGTTDIFVRDMLTGVIVRKSTPTSGIESNGESTAPSISADGRCIVFQSKATNLADSDVSSSDDIYLANTSDEAPSSYAGLNVFSNFGAFDAGETTVATSVGSDVAFAQLRLNAADQLSKIAVSINGGDFATVASEGAIENLPLQTGANTIDVKVTAADGTTIESYRYTVTRAMNSNANLSDLITVPDDVATLSPDFDSDTVAYTASVPTEVDSIVIGPIAAHPLATLTVAGKSVAAGEISEALDLSFGENVIAVKVTAEDGTTKTYTIAIQRELSSDATLASLGTNIDLETGPLPFSSQSTSYRTSLADTMRAITLTPTAQNPNATVTVNGTAVSSGSTSDPIPLRLGINTINVTVTAQDGATTQSYILSITSTETPKISIDTSSLTSGTPPKLSLTWQSESGASYIIEQSNNLEDWVPIDPEVPSAGDSTTSEFELSSPSEAPIFLRIKLK